MKKLFKGGGTVMVGAILLIFIFSRVNFAFHYFKWHSLDGE